MTVAATKLFDEFKALTPEEQLMIRDRVISLIETRQREALARLRGASAGKGLLDKLLVDRAGESEAASGPIRSARGLFAGSGLNESLLAARAEERQGG